MIAGADFGCPLGGYVLSNSRFLQLSPNTPLQIRAVKLAKVGDDVEVTLSGDNDRTRVHVVVSSLLPFVQATGGQHEQRGVSGAAVAGVCQPAAGQVGHVSL